MRLDDASRLRIYHEMLTQAIHLGRADAAYWLTRTIYRVVTDI